MKRFHFILLIMFPAVAAAQGGFKEGYLVDRSGIRYEGMLKFEPGTDTQAGQLIFKESKKGKKEVYGTNYVRSFKIEADSFAVVTNLVLGRQKTKTEDFAKVVLVGTGGVLYSLEYKVEKSSGHATTEYKDIVENTKYFLLANGKLTPLTAGNFTALAPVVSDCPALKKGIAGKKRRYADLVRIIEEYRSCKTQ
ncbi:MAG TPA: hypothetical protein VEB86_09070 [Chryseosolibacter sp.]|nr:hypothetical protein [Chryseosolibacter sp.]